MVPPLMQALRGSVGQDRRPYGTFFALAIAASDITLFGIGAPFWSLLGGLALSRLLD
jgi:benzoate membrane transport protein